MYIAVTFRYLCLSIFAWRRVVLHFFDSKQLFWVSCILWCYFSKCYKIILQNASFWCSIVICQIYFFLYGVWSKTLWIFWINFLIIILHYTWFFSSTIMNHFHPHMNKMQIFQSDLKDMMNKAWYLWLI